MTYYAHSAKDGTPAQAYELHVEKVRTQALNYAKAAAKFAKDGDALVQATEPAAVYHDLGKLDDANQEVLSGAVRGANGKLPVNHVDAGAALCKRSNLYLSAATVYAHHAGLPDVPDELARDKALFRDCNTKTIAHTDEMLGKLLEIHNSLMPALPDIQQKEPSGDLAMFLRMLLSCLADADHLDTSVNYGNYPAVEPVVELCAAKRLAALDAYVTKLGRSDGRKRMDAYVAGIDGRDDTERAKLRDEMYHACRNASVEASVAGCDSPVGSGKTTAVMANLLAVAEKRNLRRIFVVLPFTNIITQSVDIYREALALPGENSRDAVAELHHRADFESEDARHLTALWRAPIIVTTAVAFFETLASNRPSALRRLHELPGSAVFVDEAHAALPVRLLPLARKWIEVLAKDWGCYWVLASGSLTRFWEIQEIAQDSKMSVPELVNDDLRTRLSVYEQSRVAYSANLVPMTVDKLIAFVMSAPGPRLVIVNTVQSAAVIALRIRDRLGRGKVEHLSTALTPEDREKTLKRVRDRLADESDTDWVLVATSCVEAGVNLSFRNGFRELASLVALLQAAGRVNREGIYPDARMFIFCLADDMELTRNPGMQDSAAVLRNYLARGREISPALSTQSIQDEIRRAGVSSVFEELLNEENPPSCYKTIAGKFRVIDSDTSLAIVDETLAGRVRRCESVEWREIQRKSVHIAAYRLCEPYVKQLTDELWHWNIGYDEFVGYMFGMLQPLCRFLPEK
ncbi:MAG: CRISPR-associated endonuclease Cas3'' [Desulfovibrio sp.]|jgi:CRISPR-associated endonuclease/helicase Cas3|nr:CRISPR-associated endonuclease Cas3'' [Desulfovibrio sp.]